MVDRIKGFGKIYENTYGIVLFIQKSMDSIGKLN